MKAEGSNFLAQSYIYCAQNVKKESLDESDYISNPFDESEPKENSALQPGEADILEAQEFALTADKILEENKDEQYMDYSEFITDEQDYNFKGDCGPESEYDSSGEKREEVKYDETIENNFKGEAKDKIYTDDEGNYYFQPDPWSEENKDDRTLLNTNYNIIQNIYGVDYFSEQGQNISAALINANPDVYLNKEGTSFNHDMPMKLVSLEEAEQFRLSQNEAIKPEPVSDGTEPALDEAEPINPTKVPQDKITYNEQGLIEFIERPDGSSVKYEYNDDGEKTSELETQYENGVIKNTHYVNYCQGDSEGNYSTVDTEYKDGEFYEQKIADTIFGKYYSITTDENGERSITSNCITIGNEVTVYSPDGTQIRYDAKTNNVQYIKNNDEYEYINLKNANGEIEESRQSKIIGDCWLLAGVNALSYTSKGKDIIKNAIKWDDENKTATVNFRVGGDYKISYDELMEFEGSSGDIDMKLIECATEKLYNDILDGKKTIDFGTEGSDKALDSEYMSQKTEKKALIVSGNAQNIIYILTGKKADKNNDNVHKYNNAGKTAVMTVAKDNHAYSVKSYNSRADKVVLVDPHNSAAEITLSISQFNCGGYKVRSYTEL